MSKNCGCNKSRKENSNINDSYSCQTILKGLFTTVEGTQFTASMTSTGGGNDCKSAQKNSEKNIKKTLNDFLATYKPKIVKETHNIITTCDGCVNDLDVTLLSKYFSNT